MQRPSPSPESAIAPLSACPDLLESSFNSVTGIDNAGDMKNMYIGSLWRRSEWRVQARQML